MATEEENKTMNGDEFVRAAQASTDALHHDPVATIEGVFRRRRRRRVALAARFVSFVAILAVTAGLTSSILATSSSDTQVAADGSGETAPLASYRTASTPAQSLITISGVSFTYLPPNISSDFAPEENSTAAGETYVYAHLQGPCDGAGECEGSLGVTVTRSDGLTLDRYLETHWFGDSTDTTVDGLPAKANKIIADEAAGIVWSPETGTVIELHINSALAPELRKVVDGVRIE